MISALRDQAGSDDCTARLNSPVDEVVKRVNLLLKHELNRYHCVLKVESHIDMSTEIKGEVNNLVQVFDNIIINAMQAYEGRSGVIELTIVRSGDNVEFTFKDYGKGIPKNVADRFQGNDHNQEKRYQDWAVYVAFNNKGRFGGVCPSEKKAAHTFFISIPCIV